jgi:hypothetical protein
MSLEEDLRRNVLDDERKEMLREIVRPRIRPKSTDKLADYRDQWMNVDGESGPRSYEPEYT